jgi:hypothetical protein
LKRALNKKEEEEEGNWRHNIAFFYRNELNAFY